MSSSTGHQPLASGDSSVPASSIDQHPPTAEGRSSVAREGLTSPPTTFDPSVSLPPEEVRSQYQDNGHRVTSNLAPQGFVSNHGEESQELPTLQDPVYLRPRALSIAQPENEFHDPSQDEVNTDKKDVTFPSLAMTSTSKLSYGYLLLLTVAWFPLYFMSELQRTFCPADNPDCPDFKPMFISFQTYLSNFITGFSLLIIVYTIASIVPALMIGDPRYLIHLLVCALATLPPPLDLNEGGLWKSPNTFRSPYDSFWSTGMLPDIPRQCNVRVAPEQTSLFSEDIYLAQFARAMRLQQLDNDSSQQSTLDRQIYSLEAIPFDLDRFLDISRNQTLCHQGFSINGDLTGLGIRLGVYLQWISATLTNNLLPLQFTTAEGIFFTANICILIVTYAMSFTSSCVFSIEIEVLYWLYWGGFVCGVYTSPNTDRLRSPGGMFKLDWSAIVRYLANALMLYHGMWYFWYGYDQGLARLPCGTYHFLAPSKDPSTEFSIFRDVITWFVVPVATVTALGLPPFLFYLIVEDRKRNLSADEHQTQVEEGREINDLPRQQGFALELSTLPRILERTRNTRDAVHAAGGVESRRRPGSGMLMPVDISQRMVYRYFLAFVAVAAAALSGTAIELTLKRNKVVGIYSLSAPGQYTALAAGVWTFVLVGGQLLQQERQRRKDRRLRLARNESVENDEIPATLWGAFRFAFMQPDNILSSQNGPLPLQKAFRT